VRRRGSPVLVTVPLTNILKSNVRGIPASPIRGLRKALDQRSPSIGAFGADTRAFVWVSRRELVLDCAHARNRPRGDRGHGIKLIHCCFPTGADGSLAVVARSRVCLSGFNSVGHLQKKHARIDYTLRGTPALFPRRAPRSKRNGRRDARRPSSFARTCVVVSSSRRRVRDGSPMAYSPQSRSSTRRLRSPRPGTSRPIPTQWSGSLRRHRQ
jgi:hypothetical protein